MNAGFIHGVMNTDNMAISGETIDYGPCAFMEACDPATVFSSIDQHGRYAFGNQPPIAQWNLTRLAEALLPLIDDDPDRAVEMATEVLEEFPADYHANLLRGQRAKLGLRRNDRTTTVPMPRSPRTGWTCSMPGGWTSRWGGGGWPTPRRALRRRCARCSPSPQAPDAWLARWRSRCAAEDTAAGLDARWPVMNAPGRCAASIPG